MSATSVLKEIEGLLGQCEQEIEQLRSALVSPTRLGEDVQRTTHEKLKNALLELQTGRDVIACW